MTVEALIKKACAVLDESGVENSRNEARWIFESVFENGREKLIFGLKDEASSSLSDEFLLKVSERAGGRPLQYVLGSWDFYGLTFSVGEGVLTPRPETELLVDFALDYLKDKETPIVLDLCAGSGCVGLTVAANVPKASVFLLEKSDKALAYLSENKNQLKRRNAELICGDLFNGFEFFDIPKPDLILSNPPYIISSEISSLQKEVLHEPLMALDGGKDGFDFYRAIAEKWLPYCKGAIAVECGEGQASQIENYFSSDCFNVYSVKDFNGIERVVCGYVGKERK